MCKVMQLQVKFIVPVNAAATWLADLDNCIYEYMFLIKWIVSVYHKALHYFLKKYLLYIEQTMNLHQYV